MYGGKLREEVRWSALAVCILKALVDHELSHCGRHADDEKNTKIKPR